MTYTFVSYRYHTLYEFEHATLAEAIRDALFTIDGDDAWPGEIRADAKVLWKQSGPLETYGSLCAFARANGVEPESRE